MSVRPLTNPLFRHPIFNLQKVVKSPKLSITKDCRIRYPCSRPDTPCTMMASQHTRSYHLPRMNLMARSPRLELHSLQAKGGYSRHRDHSTPFMIRISRSIEGRVIQHTHRENCISRKSTRWSTCSIICYLGFANHFLMCCLLYVHVVFDANCQIHLQLRLLLHVATG